MTATYWKHCSKKDTKCDRQVQRFSKVIRYSVEFWQVMRWFGSNRIFKSQCTDKTNQNIYSAILRSNYDINIYLILVLVQGRLWRDDKIDLIIGNSGNWDSWAFSSLIAVIEVVYHTETYGSPEWIEWKINFWRWPPWAMYKSSTFGVSTTRYFFLSNPLDTQMTRHFGLEENGWIVFIW